MKRTHLWRLLPGAALILSVASPALALTLGSAQGVALIGRPLDLTVPVTLDTERDAGELCPRAEVFYGDNRVEQRQLDAPAVRGNVALLRVRVPQAVDEAFVTVQVQVGCTQSLTRRFVMLTEHPGDALTAAAQPAPVAPPVLPAATALPVLPIDADTPVPSRPTRVAQAAAVTAAEAPPARATRRVAQVPRPASQAPRRIERPRLKLDAPEALPGSVTPGVAAAPAAQPPASALAPAAAVPPAATPVPGSDDIARNTERMATLEADMRSMREMVARNEALVAELHGRLQEAQGERYSNELVYGLAALFALASAAAALFWRRSRRPAGKASTWWSDQPSSAGEPELHADDAAPVRKGAKASLPMDTLMERPAAAQPVSIMASALSGFGEVMTSDASTNATPVKQASGFTSVSDRVPLPAELPAHGATAGDVGQAGLSMDEIAEVQQQAEFFLSLGEEDRAIAVLRAQIDAFPQVSTVPWLELLDIYHRLQRQQDYEQLRRDFEWLFGASAPAYDAYEEAQRGLVAEPGLLARIEASWGSAKVLRQIEEAVMGRPGTGGSYVGIEGLRDLLMLHGVAGDLQSSDAAPPVKAETVAPAMAGSGGVDAGEPNLLRLDALPDEGWRKLAPTGARPLGLDLNLDDLDQPPAKTAPVAAAARSGDNGLDFDLDLNDDFKLPKR